MTLSWTNGNGSNRAIFAKLGNSGTASPVYESIYTAAPYPSVTQIGTTGWFCVYNGTGNSAVITGLTASKVPDFLDFQFAVKYSNTIPIKVCYGGDTFLQSL